jgi:hypothetical protein
VPAEVSLAAMDGQHRKGAGAVRGWGAQKQRHPSESPTLTVGLSSSAEHPNSVATLCAD